MSFFRNVKTYLRSLELFGGVNFLTHMHTVSEEQHQKQILCVLLTGLEYYRAPAKLHFVFLAS